MSYLKITSSRKFITFSILFAISAISIQLITWNEQASDDHNPNFLKIVANYGYKAEWHNVTTSDGYILSLFRIPPNPKSVNKFAKNQTIFLQHGLTSTANTFVLFGPDISLALILSDTGYDVWLGNFRGNTYSRRHQTISPDNPIFWDFSIDELATRDLPAMIDYALQYSNSTSMSFVGFSLSTTTVLFLLSDRPEYNDKLTTVVLLAPILKWHIVTSVRKNMIYGTRLMKWLHPTGNSEFFSRNSIISKIFTNICSTNEILLKLCYYPFEIMMGAMSTFDVDKMTLWAPQLFQGSSFKLMYQFLNIHDNGTFIHYVYDDPQINLERYGQEQVPLYNLSNIKVPLAIFRGDNDPVSIDDDVQRFIPLFKNSKKIFYETIKDVSFTHWDFVASKKGKEMVYDRMLEIIDKFS